MEVKKVKMIDYFERKLRFKDMEIWDIRLGKDIYRMLIVDENRASEIKDLNLPPNARVFEEDIRENLITVKVYSEKQVKKEHIELINQFAKHLTDHVALAHCNIHLTFYTGKTNDDIFEKIPLQQLLHFNQD
ncbi:hypothetical protein [Lysinibacillus fusiformis]|uniref:hypothetical protein n=1 Tax=Lysinibacillus fusiformis TaxID=28031 RepID=UPI0021C1B567|nr:hypothetical protein [Lysinibacillus fusiformis]UXJ67029.1 hypothetical protein N5069_12655 [Lysinibacillus fusiformis]